MALRWPGEAGSEIFLICLWVLPRTWVGTDGWDWDGGPEAQSQAPAPRAVHHCAPLIPGVGAMPCQS